MKLICINQHHVTEFIFNAADTASILAACRDAGKTWGQALVGFLIAENTNGVFVAVNIKDHDGTIESMEFCDPETGQPEFPVNSEWIAQLSTKTQGGNISLTEFSPVLECILKAPFKARRWEVYPVVNEHYKVVH